MKRILLVDDEPNLLILFEMELEEYEELHLDTATSGEVALNLIKKNQYDAILTDLTMPFMNGLELLEKIKNENIQIPIKFVLSGNPRDYYEGQRSSLEVTKYVEKPYDIELLIKDLLTFL